MRPRRPTPEHQEAVSRRLAQLSTELSGLRAGPREDPAAGDADWTSPHTRVAAPPPVGLAPAESAPEGIAPGAPPGEAPLVPVPGRHAARRVRHLLSGLVPDTLRGRVLLGAPQIAVVAVLAAVGLALTCWWLVRGDAHEVDAPAVMPSTAAALVPLTTPATAPLSTGPAPGGAAAATATDASVTVDVAGRVRDPGIAVLDAGARVVDALAAAGGARAGVDLSSLNLARVLVDGEQIVVGVPAPTGVVASAVPPPGTSAGPLVNINTATETDLEALPEVGPVTAQAIITWREENGGFSSVDELLEVNGIGDTTLGQIAPFVTV